MIKFILFMLLIFLVVLILVVGFMTRFVRIFTKRPGNSYGKQSRYQSQDNNSAPHNSHDNKKVFSKDEGEYVEYEEIKEVK